MFRKSGYRFSDKNMRQRKRSRAYSDPFDRNTLWASAVHLQLVLFDRGRDSLTIPFVQLLAVYQTSRQGLGLGDAVMAIALHGDDKALLFGSGAERA
jgi:hypothetical protein